MSIIFSVDDFHDELCALLDQNSKNVILRDVLSNVCQNVITDFHDSGSGEGLDLYHSISCMR